MSLTQPPKLLIATRNQGKIHEIARRLLELPVRLQTLVEYPEIGEPCESGVTFAENATLKGRFYAAQTGVLILAEDSGLEVDALGGAPGIFSARYAGAEASDGQRIARLLSEVKETGDRKRRARFVCAVTLTLPGAYETRVFMGKCEGHVAREPRGNGGFGYDPVFIPDGFRQTFGELPAEIKERISHRALALEVTVDFLRGFLETLTASESYG